MRRPALGSSILLAALVLVSSSALSQQPLPATRLPSKELGRAASGPRSNSRTLSLTEAVRIALQNNPSLAARGYQADADSALLQAHEGYLNPELSLEVEDFLGSGVARGVDAMQITAAISQEVQLGGKAAARQKTLRASKAVSSLEYRIAEQSLVADVATAFLEVLAHQRRLESASEMVRLAEETSTVVEFQVEAGRATPTDADKAAVVRSLASLNREAAARALLAAKQNLAATCGNESVFFGEVQGSLDMVVPLPSLATLTQALARHPALMAESAKVQQQQALLALEKANQVPDLRFSLGYRWINATTDSAVVAGVAIPLPLVNHQKGAIGAANHLQHKAEKLLRQERISRVTSQTATYHRLALEHQRATVLREEIYPKVQATYEAVREGYRIGRFGYLDLLDAQGTLFQVKEQALEALIAYHRNAIQLSRETGLPLPRALFQQRSETKAKKP